MVVDIARAYHIQSAAGKVTYRRIHDLPQRSGDFGIAYITGHHRGFIPIGDIKPCCECPVPHQLVDLVDVVFNAGAAQSIPLGLQESLHASCVLFDVYRLGKAENLQIVRRDAQPCGKAADDADSLCGALQKIVCRQHLKQCGIPAVPRSHNAVFDIRNGQAALQVIICGRDGLGRAHLIPEDDFFDIQV